MMAFFLVVLMGAAAMAIDLGWLLWQSIEIQHGADAAALAGVVYEPDLRTQAHAEALTAAAQNGYDDAMPGTDVTIVDFGDDPAAVQDDSELRATITHEVDTFFLKVLGMNSVKIRRTATARYVLPLPLGSPFSYFGNDFALGNEPGFWGNIHGTYYGRSDGDRHSALCLHASQGSGCPANPDGRLSSGAGTVDALGGYLYGIEVSSGASDLKVEIFDGPYYDIHDLFGGAAGNKLSGDDARDRNNSDIVTWFMLYGPDPTPLDTTDGNELLCSVRYEWRDTRTGDFPGWDDSWESYDEVSPAVLSAMWDNMATSADKQPGCAASFDRGPGIYPLRVMIEHSDTQGGRNHYTLRTSTVGPQPNIYGLGDMSIFSLREGGETELYLAKIEERYAGDDLVIELWDVGDITGKGSDKLSILDGDGDILDCEWVATDNSPVGKPNKTSGGPGECTIRASNKKFNDELITITIHLADDYTCSGDKCWFRVLYDYTGTVQDSTTWSVHLDGNPIRIIR